MLPKKCVRFFDKQHDKARSKINRRVYPASAVEPTPKNPRPRPAIQGQRNNRKPPLTNSDEIHNERSGICRCRSPRCPRWCRVRLIETSRKAPGRRPPQALIEQSEWYKALDDDQKRIVASIIHDVAHFAVFNFLCVIDGVSAIEDGPDTGHLELHSVKDTSILLNSEAGEMLHDLL